MQTTDYITREVKALDPSDKVNKAKELFKELTYTHLPVVEEGLLLGLVSEADIQTIENGDLPLDDFRYLFQSFFVSESINWFE
ncbi:MAG: CBS domain-containing protein, partial [Flavobacteriaceae bacterium]|nr:CBS domain-containing protein [Flavobacteriaceae bacterium]